MTTGRINQVTFVRPESRCTRRLCERRRGGATTSSTIEPDMPDSRTVSFSLTPRHSNEMEIRQTGRACVMVVLIQTIKCHRPVRQRDTRTPLYTEGIGRVLWCDLFGSFVLFLGRASYKCSRAMDRVGGSVVPHYQPRDRACRADF